MKHDDTAPTRGSTPMERVDHTQRKVAELRALLARFRDAIDGQQISLRRLGQSRRAGQPAEEQDKAIRQLVASLMLFEALGGQMDSAFTEFEEPLVSLIEDVTAQLRDREQLTALSRSAEALNSSLDLNDVLQQAMRMLVDLTGAERAFFMLSDPETGTLRVRVSHNIDAQQLESSAFAISRTILEAVVRKGQAVVTTNAAADPRFSDQASIALHSLRSIICVPIRVEGKVEGVVYADNRVATDIFSDTDRDFTAAFASQAAAALENARLFEKVNLARNMMHNVFESVPSAVIATDERGRISLVNRAAATILSLSPGEMIGQGYARLAPWLGGQLSALFDEMYEVLREVGRDMIEGELEGRGKVFLSASAAPLTDSNGEPIGAVMLLDDRTESMRFERERGIVKRYLPEALVDSFSVLQEVSLGGARSTVTVLFADIRGFTSFSENRDPAQVVEAINTYFGFASAAVQSHGGIVDKYMGDAVMAHFNSPLLPQGEHAWLAVRTAWEVRRLMQEFVSAPSEKLSFGIGVNTGTALAGNVGGKERMEYTLIGDAVNLAKRLQEMASGDQILLGETTYQAVRDRVKVIDAGSLNVKGRTAPENVFELVALRD
jgi:PAS domain S-box-containing protein